MLEVVLTIEASGGIAPIVTVLQLWMSVDKRYMAGNSPHYYFSLLLMATKLFNLFWRPILIITLVSFFLTMYIGSYTNKTRVYWIFLGYNLEMLIFSPLYSYVRGFEPPSIRI